MRSWRSAGTASLALLLDTHVLLWVATDDPRLSRAARAAIFAPDAEMLVSAVTVYEFEHLRVQGRFGPIEPIGVLLDALDAALLDYPADASRLIALLPTIHRDPLDRMLIAHAIHADLELVTADAAIHRYPVRTLW